MQSNDPIIVLANSAKAKIYRYESKNKKLTLLSEPTHSESTLKTSEIMTDERGRYQTSVGPNQGTYQSPSDPKTVEAEKFAAQLSDCLADIETQFESFHIFAPGHFQHFLKHKLSKPVLNKIKDFFDKDYTKLHIKELEKHLTEQLNLKF